MNSIKFPIAIRRDNNELADIFEVENGLKCNCYCFHCNADLIAANGGTKVAPHFKHAPDANCSANYETFIHWVTKEIFKTFTYFQIPEIDSSDLKDHPDFNQEAFEKNVELIYKEFQVPEIFQQTYRFSMVLQKSLNIDIEECLIEKSFKSDAGDVRVDIVLKMKDQYLFVEPYFTNPISPNKELSLKLLDISTLQINLGYFQVRGSRTFSLQELRKFLQDSSQGYWYYIRTKKVEKLTKKYLSKIRAEIKSHVPIFNKYRKLLSKEKRVEKEINEVHKEWEKIRKKREELGAKNDDIAKKKNKLLNQYYSKASGKEDTRDYTSSFTFL